MIFSTNKCFLYLATFLNKQSLTNAFRVIFTYNVQWANMLLKNLVPYLSMGETVSINNKKIFLITNDINNLQSSSIRTNIKHIKNTFEFRCWFYALHSWNSKLFWKGDTKNPPPPPFNSVAMCALPKVERLILIRE